MVKELKKVNIIAKKPKVNVESYEQLFVDPYSKRGKINEEIQMFKKMLRSTHVSREKLDKYSEKIGSKLTEAKKKIKLAKMKSKVLRLDNEEILENTYDLLNPASQSYFVNLVPKRNEGSKASRYANFLEYKSKFSSTNNMEDLTEVPTEKSKNSTKKLSRISMEEPKRRTVI